MYVRSIHFILNESNSTENTKNIFEILLENVRLKVFFQKLYIKMHFKNSFFKIHLKNEFWKIL